MGEWDERVSVRHPRVVRVGERGVLAGEPFVVGGYAASQLGTEVKDGDVVRDPRKVSDSRIIPSPWTRPGPRRRNESL